MIILDIRTRKEFVQGHVCGATLIPTPLPTGSPASLSKKERGNLIRKLKKELKEVNKNTEIAVYCKKGIRSNIAKNILNNLGYHNVVDLGGVETKTFWDYQLPFCDKKH